MLNQPSHLNPFIASVVILLVIHFCVCVGTPASDDEDFSEGEQASDSDSDFDDVDSDFNDSKTKGRSKAKGKVKAAPANKKSAAVRGRKGRSAHTAQNKGWWRGQEVTVSVTSQDSLTARLSLCKKQRSVERTRGHCECD